MIRLRDDTESLRQAFLAHLEAETGARTMIMRWQQAGILEVRRAFPTPTKMGKVQPFHLARTRPPHRGLRPGPGGACPAGGETERDSLSKGGFPT